MTHTTSFHFFHMKVHMWDCLDNFKSKKLSSEHLTQRRLLRTHVWNILTCLSQIAQDRKQLKQKLYKLEIVQSILNVEDNFLTNLHKEELCILFFCTSWYSPVVFRTYDSTGTTTATSTICSLKASIPFTNLHTLFDFFFFLTLIGSLSHKGKHILHSHQELALLN